MYVCMSTFYSAPSRFPLRGTSDNSADTKSEFHAQEHEQLRVKDLPRVLSGGLRWVRTLKPPAARHRTYPYTTAPHMYVCMYVYMYVCMFVCMHICMCVCMYVCMYVCLYVCMFVCVYVCMCVCVCMTSVGFCTCFIV